LYCKVNCESYLTAQWQQQRKGQSRGGTSNARDEEVKQYQDVGGACRRKGYQRCGRGSKYKASKSPSGIGGVKRAHRRGAPFYYGPSEGPDERDGVRDPREMGQTGLAAVVGG